MPLPSFPRRAYKPTSLLSLSLLLLTLPFFYILLHHHPTHLTLPPSPISTSPKNTPILTLHFKANSDIPSVEHNCALLHAQHTRYIIYTDHLNASHCRVCECVPFTPMNCPCPNPGHDACNHCEKLYFLVHRLEQFQQFVFLDSDVIILKDDFPAKLFARGQLDDMLASRAQHRADLKKYYGDFNSGVMFWRRVEGVDYGKMVKNMYEGKRNRDQSVVSQFVFRYYRNWDRLSVKWHCRALKREQFDIPPTECLTLHDRHERDRLLKDLGVKLRKVDVGGEKKGAKA